MVIRPGNDGHARARTTLRRVRSAHQAPEKTGNRDGSSPLTPVPLREEEGCPPYSPWILLSRLRANCTASLRWVMASFW